jgi:hypothetical protein
MYQNDCMSRFDECRLHALEHADVLIDRIKLGQMNASAFEGVMRSYLHQPGYDETFRKRLLDLCMTRLDGRER